MVKRKGILNRLRSVRRLAVLIMQYYIDPPDGPHRILALLRRAIHMRRKAAQHRLGAPLKMLVIPASNFQLNRPTQTAASQKWRAI